MQPIRNAMKQVSKNERLEGRVKNKQINKQLHGTVTKLAATSKKKNKQKKNSKITTTANMSLFIHMLKTKISFMPYYATCSTYKLHFKTHCITV